VIFPPPGRAANIDDEEAPQTPRATREVAAWLVVFAFLAAFLTQAVGLDWDYVLARVRGEPQTLIVPADSTGAPPADGPATAFPTATATEAGRALTAEPGGFPFRPTSVTTVEFPTEPPDASPTFEFAATPEPVPTATVSAGEPDLPTLPPLRATATEELPTPPWPTDRPGYPP
jgi:hypothetical protein